MSMAKRILMFGGLGLTVSHLANANQPMWWWIATSYAGLAAIVLTAHWRKWTV